MWVRSLNQEDALEKELLPTPVFLPQKFHGRRTLAGYSPADCKEPDTTDHTHILPSGHWWWEEPFWKFPLQLISAGTWPQLVSTSFGTPASQAASGGGTQPYSPVGQLPQDFPSPQLPWGLAMPTSMPTAVSSQQKVHAVHIQGSHQSWLPMGSRLLGTIRHLLHMTTSPRLGNITNLPKT